MVQIKRVPSLNHVKSLISVRTLTKVKSEEFHSIRFADKKPEINKVRIHALKQSGDPSRRKLISTASIKLDMLSVASFVVRIESSIAIG